jgi:preprotein translocase subunit SecD
MAQHPHRLHMTRGDWLRLVVVLGVAVASIALIVYPPRPLREIVQLGLDLQGGVRMVLEGEGVDEMSPDLRAETIDRLITIIDNRINQYGLANTEVRVFGGNRILVNLPGATDPEAARQLIGQTALLEFRRVVEAGSSPLDDLSPRSSTQELLRNRDGVPFIVGTEILLTGAALSDARVRTSQSLTAAGQYQIALTFTQEGAQEFARILLQLGAGERLAIVLDNTVYSAPVIQESIVQVARSQGWRGVQDGSSISGINDADEARILAVALRAGALPVAVRVAEETTVGPRLGDDSIRRGMMTIVIGFLLILIYMMVFYRVLGVVANLALILNMLIVFGALVLFRAVLTLPGIAGIILTIGMTVDANVIIFERVKEERRTGKSPLAAVRSGFEKSLSTLLDANITTLITALILLLLGTGPIRGFAITLGIGVAGSLFCALVASRLLLEKAGFSTFIPVRVSEPSE